jgi:RND family efflux transporter MFP subunit
MSERKNKIIRFLKPFAVVLIGIVIMAALAANRKAPPKIEKEFAGALVEVFETKIESRVVVIEATGTVKPRYEVNLIPQVAGKVEQIHPKFLAGGTFKKGETLLVIEQNDYQLAVRQREAGLAQAEYQLDVARANADIALREWELMNQAKKRSGNEENMSKPSPLVLHEPQLKQAQANYASAEAALEMSQLSLDRTVIKAPFNCRVRRMSVAPGQLVGQGTVIGSLYATDLVEIEVGLPLADLEWLQIPGSEAEVELNSGNKTYTWQGTIDRSIGVLDEIGRMARVVVMVKNPFNSNGNGQPDLNIGSFVNVSLLGREIGETIAIPRSAFRQNSTVWVADKDDKLQIRDVKYLRITPTEVLLETGVYDGEKVILTTLSGASEGMKLRISAVDGGLE